MQEMNSLREDSRFLKSRELSIGEIAALTGAAVQDGTDLNRGIDHANTLDLAGPRDICFVDKSGLLALASSTSAGACFCKAEHADSIGQKTATSPGRRDIGPRQRHRDKLSMKRSWMIPVHGMMRSAATAMVLALFAGAAAVESLRAQAEPVRDRRRRHPGAAHPHLGDPLRGELVIRDATNASCGRLVLNIPPSDV
jgi:hypothetical protein